MIIIIFRNIISGFLDIIDSVLHSDTNMCGLDHRNVVLLISDRNRAGMWNINLFHQILCAGSDVRVDRTILQILFTGEKGVAFSFCPGGIGFLETF